MQFLCFSFFSSSFRSSLSETFCTLGHLKNSSDERRKSDVISLSSAESIPAGRHVLRDSDSFHEKTMVHRTWKKVPRHVNNYSKLFLETRFLRMAGVVLYITVRECDTAALFRVDVTSSYFSITRWPYHVLLATRLVSFPELRYNFLPRRPSIKSKTIVGVFI